MRTSYQIEGMRCGACVNRVTQALQGIPGVSDVLVTLQPPRVELESPQPLDIRALQNVVSTAGNYTLHELQTRETKPAPAIEDGPTSPPQSLYPLLLIVGYILGTVVVIELLAETPSWHRGMRHFMAGFFLVFSFFKLLDLRGFVSAYRGYDLLAAAVGPWAWLYPFVELGLGIAYLMDLSPVAVNGVTLTLMLVGSLGVVRALLDRRAIRCACLGTALNLPMTKVTLIEDLTMAGMAGVMLLA